MPKNAAILYFQQNSTWGAGEEYFQILIEGVKRERPHWDIVLMCPEDRLTDWKNAMPASIQVMPRSPGFARLICQIASVGAHLIHTNDPQPQALAAARLTGIPYKVMTYHTPALNIYYNWKGTLLWEFGRRAKNLHVIAVSEVNRQSLIHKWGFSASNVCAIEYGLRSDKFLPERNTGHLKAELGIPENTHILLCLARLAPQKAHDVLLEAFARASKRSSRPLCLLLAGDGELAESLKQYANHLELNDSVRFLGHRNDVPDLLSMTDLFTLASDFEGLPFAMLEAMAMAKRIIVTAVDGIKDAMVDKKTGLLVPPRDVEALTEAILWSVDHPKEHELMGQEARKVFMKKYSAERMIRQTLDFYESLSLS